VQLFYSHSGEENNSFRADKSNLSTDWDCAKVKLFLINLFNGAGWALLRREDCLKSPFVSLIIKLNLNLNYLFISVYI